MFWDDVSNEFHRLWLYENMVYSCAYFENGDEDLATAQLKKIDDIPTKIELRPGAGCSTSVVGGARL